MSDLAAFLADNVEGYLFADLETLKAAVPPVPVHTTGACHYPLLATTFAGIELLGALLDPGPFDKRAGAQYFDLFWKQYLYSNDRDRAAAGPILYQLARHGIAHLNVTKGDITVVKGESPKLHLVILPDGSVCIDAARLADELKERYFAEVKPLASHPVIGPRLAAQLDEMSRQYREQAAALQTLTLPRLPAAPHQWTSVPSLTAFSVVMGRSPTH